MPESLATYSNRLSSNRNSAYSPARSTSSSPPACPASTPACSSGVTATLDPETPKNPAFYERVKGDTPEKTEKNAQQLFERLKEFAFAGQDSTATLPAPGCTQQAPFEPIYGSGPSTTYQHTFEQGE